ncbi:MAG: hypothetical protein U0R26_11915 [Solirubrobacterales bacterium]
MVELERLREQWVEQGGDAYAAEVMLEVGRMLERRGEAGIEWIEIIAPARVLLARQQKTRRESAMTACNAPPQPTWRRTGSRSELNQEASDG